MAAQGEDTKITWQEGLAASIVMVDFHLIHIQKLIEHPEIKKALLEGNSRETGAPLHMAASLGRTEILEMLIDIGMDVNGFASGFGSWMTPLHYAAIENHIDAAEMLIDNGADPDERGFMDSLKGTPLDFAKNKGHQEMVEFLSKYSTAAGDTPRPISYHPDVPQNVGYVGSRRRSVGSAATRGTFRKPTAEKNRTRGQSVPPKK